MKRRCADFVRYTTAINPLINLEYSTHALFQHVHHLEYFPFTIEYNNVPMMVIVDPKMPKGEMGFLNAMTDAMIITTRLIVLPTAWVIGWTRPSAMNATSL